MTTYTRPINSDANSQPKQTTPGGILTQQLLIEKFDTFVERAFKNDPSLNLYLKEWESFKTLLSTKQLDYDKIYAHISKVLSVPVDAQNPGSILSARGPLSLNKLNGRPSENALATPIPTDDGKAAEANYPLTTSYRSPSKKTPTYSTDLRAQYPATLQVNRSELLNRFQKLKTGMKVHTENLIKLTQRRELTQSSFSKSGDRTPLRRVAVYTKDNQKTEIFKEIEENLNFIKESNYNNYRILN